jgi:bifunctional DNase/RNase
MIRSLLLIIALFITISCQRNKSYSNEPLPTLSKAEVEVLSLLKSPDPQNIKLTLGLKNDTTIKIEMLISSYDAQTLAVVLEGLKPTAPLPLDLLEDAIKKFDYQVQEVVIDSLINNYYTAKIICHRGDKIVALKARPVDAIVIASKFKTAIFANSIFLEQ